MTHEEALKNKVACIEAFLRGEKVEVRSYVDGSWDPIATNAMFDSPGDRYRIAAKPEPKIPSGVFWIRFKDRPGRERLVTVVEDGFMCYATPRGELTSNNKLALGTANGRWQWSHDRITWKEFTES